jgi:integrase
MIQDALRKDPKAMIPQEVFIHNRGKRGALSACSESGLDGVMERIITGMEEMYGRDLVFSHHTIRSTLGRILHKKKQPIENIQHILGHESPTMTYQYLGLDLDDQKESFDVLEEHIKDSASSKTGILGGEPMSWMGSSGFEPETSSVSGRRHNR